MTNKQLVYAWADGTWCRPEELDEMLAYMSDDYAHLLFPIEYDEEHIDEAVNSFNRMFESAQ